MTARNYVISPTFDWKPSSAFPSIDGAFHWSVLDADWRRVDHGFVDTFEQAQEAVAR